MTGEPLWAVDLHDCRHPELPDPDVQYLWTCECGALWSWMPPYGEPITRKVGPWWKRGRPTVVVYQPGATWFCRHRPDQLKAVESKHGD